jgi:predicted amidohydrolase
MSFRVAVVQPLTRPPPDDASNVEEAERQIARAAAQGADFVCFPESYPGPWRMPMGFDPSGPLAEAAARHELHVIFGTLEPIDARRAHNLICLVYPDGRAIARYRRTHPNGPWIYQGGPRWDFHYVPGDDFPVFDTKFGKIGLAMCSEVFMPEVSRALALRGAEILFMPAGGDKQQLWATWRTLIWARAIENLAIVVTTQNKFKPGDRGLAMVATPEDILFESEEAGLFVVDVTLDRIRYLRATRDEGNSQETCAAKQGVLGPQWQRPKLYEGIYPRGEADAAK